MDVEGDSPKQEAGTSGHGVKKSKNKKSPKKGMKVRWPTLVRPSKHPAEDEGARPKKKPRIMEGLMEELLEDEDDELDIDDSADDPKDSVLSSVANELAEKIATNAAKTNLSATNVKSILHHLLTDKMLLDFAQRVALEQPEANVQPSSTFDHGTRLTRSRWKQTKGVTQKELQIFDKEFETEDSEDEEYDPENESMVTQSDDESIPTPFSDQPSPSLPRTPDSRLSTIKELEIEQSTLTDLNEDGEPIFKMPGTPLSASKPKFLDETAEEIIASRTRSKISMKDLSLEALTASLEPPDYDPALYDYLQPDELDHDDLEWQNWLKGLFTQEDDDETTEENDEDFNFMAFEEELDQEEFRYDKAVKVTQKELQDLLDGILDDFGETVEDQSSILKYVIPQYSMTYAQKQQLSAQLQQHTQLLAQTYLLCYRESYLNIEASNSKVLLQELSNFRKAVDEDETLRDISAYCYDGLEEAVRFVDSVHDTSELEETLAREDETTQRPKKISKKIRSDFCVDMPPRIGLKILSEPYLATYPELLPEQGAMAFDKQVEMEKELRIKFHKSEDNLIALGMSQFWKDFEMIAKHMMPIATVKQIATRAQNLASKREDFWNPVKMYWKTKQLPALKTAVCVNNPRTISTQSIKENYRMLSYAHRLPLWIDRLCEHLGRLDVINLKKQQQTFAPQYPVVFQFAAIAPKEMPVQEKVELNLPKKPKRRRNRRKKRDQSGSPTVVLYPSQNPYPVQLQLIGQNEILVKSAGENPVRSLNQNSVSSYDKNLVQTYVQSLAQSLNLVHSSDLKPVHNRDQSTKPVITLEQKQNTVNSPVQTESRAECVGHISGPVQSAESNPYDISSPTSRVNHTGVTKTEIPATEIPTTDSQTSTGVEMVLNPRKSMQRIRTWRVQQPFDATPRVTKISQGVQTCETTSQGVQTGKEFVEIPSPTKRPRFVSTHTQTESILTEDIGVPETNVARKTVSTSTQDTGKEEFNSMTKTTSTTTEDIGISETNVILQTDLVNSTSTGIPEPNFMTHTASTTTEDIGISETNALLQSDLFNSKNTGVPESNFTMNTASSTTENTGIPETSVILQTDLMNATNIGIAEPNFITHTASTTTEDIGISETNVLLQSDLFNSKNTGVPESNFTMNTASSTTENTGIPETSVILQTDLMNASNIGIAEPNFITHTASTTTEDIGIPDTSFIMQTDLMNVTKTGIVESNFRTHAASMTTEDIGIPETRTTVQANSMNATNTGILEPNFMTLTASTTTENTGIPETRTTVQLDLMNATNTGIADSNFMMNNALVTTEDTGLADTRISVQTDLMNAANTGISEPNVMTHTASTITGDIGLADTRIAVQTDFVYATNTGIAESSCTMNTALTTNEDTGVIESNVMTTDSMSIEDTGILESNIMTQTESTNSEEPAITDSDVMAPEDYDCSDEGESACSTEALHGDDTDDAMHCESHCEVNEPCSPEVPFNQERLTTASETPVKLNLPVATEISESKATLQNEGLQTTESLLSFTNFLSETASPLTSSATASASETSSPSSPINVSTCTVSISPLKAASIVTPEESDQFSKENFMSTMISSTSNLKTPEDCSKEHFMSATRHPTSNLQAPEYRSKEDIAESGQWKKQLFTSASTTAASILTQADSCVGDMQPTQENDSIGIEMPVLSHSTDASVYVEPKELSKDVAQSSEALRSNSDAQILIKTTERIKTNIIGVENSDDWKSKLEDVNEPQTFSSEDTALSTEDKVVLQLDIQGDFNIQLASDADSHHQPDSMVAASMDDKNLVSSVVNEEMSATNCPEDRTLLSQERGIDFECHDDVDNEAKSPVENEVKSHPGDDDEAAVMPQFDLELEPSPIRSNPESGSYSYDEDGFEAEEGVGAEGFAAEAVEDDSYNEELGPKGQEEACETEQNPNDNNVLKEVNEGETLIQETSRRNSITDENFVVEDIDDKESREDVENEDPKIGRKESPKETSTGRPVSNPRRKSKGRKSTFNWEEKLQEKASKFADLYFEKVKETLTEKPTLYCDFLKVIDEAGKLGTNRVEVFWKLSELLKDYAELVEMFVGFLDPAQAREVGQFKAWLEFEKATNFLLSCEAYLVKTKYYHEFLRKTIELKETGKDPRKFIDSIRPLLRGNDELVAELTTMFPGLPPPQRRGDDFEVIQYRPEMNGFDHVDDFEEVKLLPSDYIVNEDPQNRKKTILDNFAAWLQKPALKAVDVRTELTEVKKNDAISCLVKNDSKRGKVIENDLQTAVLDSPNAYIGESTNDGKSQRDVDDLAGSTKTVPAQDRGFHTIYGVRELPDNDSGISSNFKSTESHQNLNDSGQILATVTYQIRSRPQLHAGRTDSRLLDVNEGDDFVTRGERCKAFVPNRSGSPHSLMDDGLASDLDSKSPEFNPPLKRTSKKGVSRLRTKSDSVALRRSEKTSIDTTSEQCGSSNNSVAERQQNILGASPLSRNDCTPEQVSIINDKKRETTRETIPCQISPLCATKAPDTLNGSFISPLQRKMNSTTFKKLGSPLGTKLTTFRLNVSNPDQSSGFQKIGLNELDVQGTEGREPTNDIRQAYSHDRHMVSPDSHMIRTESHVIQPNDHMNITSSHMIRTDSHIIRPDDHMNQTSSYMIRTNSHVIRPANHMNQTSTDIIRTDSHAVEPGDHTVEPNIDMIRTESHMSQLNDHVNLTSYHMIPTDRRIFQPDDNDPNSQLIRSDTPVFQSDSDTIQSDGQDTRSDSHMVGHDSRPSSVGSSFAGTDDADCSDNSDDSGDKEVMSDATSRTTLGREDGLSPAMSAGDVSYDESGRVVAKWSRDDDRVILTSCRQNGATDSTFEEIAEKLPGRMKTEVKERFLKLMELFSAVQKK